jgi:16S rRNA (guanine527-N7)-methyltransferase
VIEAAGTDLRATLDEGVSALGLDLPAEARRRLVDYVALLDKWNRTYNLTAIREPAKMVTHHLLDTLAALPELDARAPGAARVLDVGSGAGLPGVPFAIARPSWTVDMLEPVHKKATFITQAIAELGIRNAAAIAARVEDHRPNTPYPIVVSRAFADLAAFADASARHLSADGLLVAMKGVHPDEELAELPASYAVERVVPLAVPGVNAARHLVLVRKRSA